jgi:hypothetical protein
VVLQSLAEKGLLKTPAGEASFAVLLFQDIAVIPLIATLPLLATLPRPVTDAAHGHVISNLPAGQHALLILGAITILFLAGRFLVRPFFRLIAGTGLREMFTAATLFLVLGIVLLMKETGANWQFISMKSGGERVAALLGGHVDMMIMEPAEAMEQIRAGKIRVIATLMNTRLPSMPDASTLKEQGFKAPEIPQSRGFVGPPGPAVQVHHQRPRFVHRQVAGPGDDELLGARIQIALAER